MSPLEQFEVRILRQDSPSKASYWQGFRLTREQGLNVTGVLQRIATHPRTETDEPVAPIAYEANCLEEVCGSCRTLQGRSWRCTFEPRGYKYPMR